MRAKRVRLAADRAPPNLNTRRSRKRRNVGSCFRRPAAWQAQGRERRSAEQRAFRRRGEKKQISALPSLRFASLCSALPGARRSVWRRPGWRGRRGGRRRCRLSGGRPRGTLGAADRRTDTDTDMARIRVSGRAHGHTHGRKGTEGCERRQRGRAVAGGREAAWRGASVHTRPRPVGCGQTSAREACAGRPCPLPARAPHSGSNCLQALQLGLNSSTNHTPVVCPLAACVSCSKLAARRGWAASEEGRASAWRGRGERSKRRVEMQRKLRWYGAMNQRAGAGHAHHARTVG